MIKVFLSGSRSISRLNDEVRARLDEMLETGATIVVGDAPGADKAFQAHLADKDCTDVVVYCSGTHSRNNVGDWERKMVMVGPGLKGREFYSVKDRAMARDADRGLVLWDGKSLGSLQNAIELLDQGKPVTVYLAPAETFFEIATWEELRPLYEACSEKTKRLLEERIDYLRPEPGSDDGVTQLTLGF
ncbi:MAG: hypothetical protein KC931_01230 [Candidatus Omnitrophica bacterium]|nr:hypothetical protein [Candidatus Omnitrophota bacterium]MCA9445706.1 hypothetical protein [Candidatus Omnitrophota bacterium]MCB9770278.1 hypothetical protein [Candidatus Omnitrophota bacterium]